MSTPRFIDPQATDPKLFQYLVRIGDDLLILGHRLSEWCGHAPILEEDIALANIALDCIGQSNAFLSLAAATEGQSRTADDLAFLRDPGDFRNLQLVEQPNGDFGVTIVRQVLFDAYALPFFEGLSKSSNLEIAGAAGKAVKETSYHLRHCSDWLIRLGQGTEESNSRVQAGLNDLWDFTYELGAEDDLDRELSKRGLAPSLKEVRAKWESQIADLLKKAGLKRPEDNRFHSSGSRSGIHSEHLGHLLAEMQVLRRSYPQATW